MMRFGCCSNMISKTPDVIGDYYISSLKKLGYDYVELPLAGIAQLGDAQFEQVVQNLQDNNMKCEVCNILFPRGMKLFSLDTASGEIEAYLYHAFARAEKMGVEYVVFGSGPSRMVPEGMSLENAWSHLVKLTRAIGEVAKQYNITIVIEPLRKAECNIVNRVREGHKLVQCVDHSNVKLLVDFYHLTLEQEDPEIIVEAAIYIKHVHLANTNGRIFPKSIDEDNYRPFLDSLRKINYCGRVSVESYTNDFEQDALDSINFLKSSFNGGVKP
jgi:D-psicose/D-tagatose/L-ribulose 3-epimerase